jgi:hypothetical protein
LNSPSSITLNALSWEGSPKTYRAESEFTAEFWGDPRTKEYGERQRIAVSNARKEVTKQNIEKLIMQIQADASYFKEGLSGNK